MLSHSEGFCGPVSEGWMVSEYFQVASATPGAAKAAIRARLLNDRREQNSTADDEALRRHLGALIRGTVAAFNPLPSEPGGVGLPEVLAAGACRLLLPVLRADLDLDWAQYTGTLTAAAFGLHEPDGPRLGPTAIGDADLVLVPAVAVDHRGVRLGRGGGSYDRALRRIGPHTLTIGVIYDRELVDELPEEAHDQRLAAVVTPSAGLVRLPLGPPE